MGRVYTFPVLGHVGRLGNMLWQTSAVINMSLNDPGSRPSLPHDWEYRSWLQIPDAVFRPIQDGEEQVDCSRHPSGPYFQFLSSIDKVAPGLPRLFGPSRVARERLQERWDSLNIPDTHLTALHIRRTDYLENESRFPQLSPAYFQRGLKEVRQQHPGSVALIFSDDIEWCKQNAQEWFGDGPTLLVEDPHVRPIPPHERTGAPLDIVDLWIMASTDAKIIANSTYSWWAAFLGRECVPWLREPHSASVPIFYPDRWYGPDAQHSDRMWEAFPSSWRQLPC